MAHERGLVALTADWTFNDAELSLAHAVATFQDGRRFEESGDATPANTNRKVAVHFRRVALTRAKSYGMRSASTGSRLRNSLRNSANLGQGMCPAPLSTVSWPWSPRSYSRLMPDTDRVSWAILVRQAQVLHGLRAVALLAETAFFGGLAGFLLCGFAVLLVEPVEELFFVDVEGLRRGEREAALLAKGIPPDIEGWTRYRSFTYKFNKPTFCLVETIRHFCQFRQQTPHLCRILLALRAREVVARAVFLQLRQAGHLRREVHTEDRGVYRLPLELLRRMQAVGASCRGFVWQEPWTVQFRSAICQSNFDNLTNPPFFD
jgi:hypothetical protein